MGRWEQGGLGAVVHAGWFILEAPVFPSVPFHLLRRSTSVHSQGKWSRHVCFSILPQLPFKKLGWFIKRSREGRTLEGKEDGNLEVQAPRCVWPGAEAFPGK